MTTSVDQNVISNATGILTVSSRSAKKSSSSSNATDHALEAELELDSYEEVMMAEMSTMRPYEEHMCSYLASCIEEKFHMNVRQYKFKCIACAGVLSNANDKINDEMLQMKGTTQPSASTLKIVIFVNAVMNMYSTQQQQQGNSFNTILKVISENFDIDDAFLEFYSFAHEEKESSANIDHKRKFISELIKIFMMMKSKSISRKITDIERGELIRYKRKHAYLAAGQ